MLDPYAIRDDFPIFNVKIHGKPLVYLDNAATSHRPKQVVEAIKRFYEEYNANVERGLHYLSQKASEMYEEAHEVVAKFTGAQSWEEIVFTYNSTYALNMLALMLGFTLLKKEDEILITIMEHHSNMLPWRLVAEKVGAKVKYVTIKSDYTLNYKDLENKISDKTKIVAITQMSNVLGTINDIKYAAKLARKVGAIVVADGAQSVPHMPINVRELGVDFLVFSSHKMLGPTGLGVLYGRKDLLEELKPVIAGGGTIKDVTLKDVRWAELPERFEAGTPHIAGAIGLAEAVRYLEKIGMENVREHEKQLTEYALKLMNEELGGFVTHYGPTDLNVKGGIIAFNVKNYDHHAVAAFLDTEGIAVRSGMHCAHPLHHHLGLKGTVRASFYLYNTREDVDALIDALKKLRKISK
ncbi:MAG: cysteine desulfurase [Thermoprotei archaeon]|nr:MAG: cysteine desulfurase [Thermoprotei archaeon]